MSASSGYSNSSDLDDIEDVDLVMQLINQDQQVQRRSRNPINRERDIAKARLMANYFGPSLKYPIVPYEVNGVTFEKGYYLADGIYAWWSTFVRSFTVARDEKNAVFKRRQESARKNVERAFGVLQIVTQLVRANGLTCNSGPGPNARVVYIDGGFDLIHVGHIKIQKNARQLGDFLLVGICTDLLGVMFPS
nr:ribosomal protein [Tanacetum cinerariifolium]